MATAKKSVSSAPLLVSMVGVLGMLVFTILAYKAGNLTLMYLGLAGVIVGLVVMMAIWQNWDTMKTWPGSFGKAVGKNGARILGSILGVMIFAAVVYLAALIFSNENLHRPIAAPTSSTTTAGATRTLKADTSFVEITKAWGDWINVPEGYDAKWHRVDSTVSYEVQLPSGNIYPYNSNVSEFVRIAEDGDRFRVRIQERTPAESSIVRIILEPSN